jgi:hypothetical protein
VLFGPRRGVEPEQLDRRLGLESHLIATRRKVLPDGGNVGLNGDSATTKDNRRRRGTQRKIGKLALLAHA